MAEEFSFEGGIPSVSQITSTPQWQGFNEEEKREAIGIYRKGAYNTLRQADDFTYDSLDKFEEEIIPTFGVDPSLGKKLQGVFQQGRDAAAQSFDTAAIDSLRRDITALEIQTKQERSLNFSNIGEPVAGSEAEAELAKKKAELDIKLPGAIANNLLAGEKTKASLKSLEIYNALPEDPAAYRWFFSDKSRVASFITGSFVENAPNAALTIGAGVAAGPAGAAAAGGAVEYSAALYDKVLEAGTERGLDTSDPDVIAELMRDDDVVAAARKKAGLGAAIIGAVDAAMFKVGSKLGKAAAKMFGKAATSTAGKVAQNTGKSAAVLGAGALDVAGEGAGEAAKQFVVDGEVAWKDVFKEAAGGAGPAITGAAKEVLRINKNLLKYSKPDASKDDVLALEDKSLSSTVSDIEQAEAVDIEGEVVSAEGEAINGEEVIEDIPVAIEDTDKQINIRQTIKYDKVLPGTREITLPNGAKVRQTFFVEKPGVAQKVTSVQKPKAVDKPAAVSDKEVKDAISQVADTEDLIEEVVPEAVEVDEFADESPSLVVDDGEDFDGDFDFEPVGLWTPESPNAEPEPAKPHRNHSGEFVPAETMRKYQEISDAFRSNDGKMEILREGVDANRENIKEHIKRETGWDLSNDQLVELGVGVNQSLLEDGEMAVPSDFFNPQPGWLYNKAAAKVGLELPQSNLDKAIQNKIADGATPEPTDVLAPNGLESREERRAEGRRLLDDLKFADDNYSFARDESIKSEGDNDGVPTNALLDFARDLNRKIEPEYNIPDFIDEVNKAHKEGALPDELITEFPTPEIITDLEGIYYGENESLSDAARPLLDAYRNLEPLFEREGYGKDANALNNEIAVQQLSNFQQNVSDTIGDLGFGSEAELRNALSKEEDRIADRYSEVQDEFINEKDEQSYDAVAKAISSQINAKEDAVEIVTQLVREEQSISDEMARLDILEGKGTGRHPLKTKRGKVSKKLDKVYASLDVSAVEWAGFKRQINDGRVQAAADTPVPTTRKIDGLRLRSNDIKMAAHEAKTYGKGGLPAKFFESSTRQLVDKIDSYLGDKEEALINYSESPSVDPNIEDIRQEEIDILSELLDAHNENLENPNAVPPQPSSESAPPQPKDNPNIPDPPEGVPNPDQTQAQVELTDDAQSILEMLESPDIPIETGQEILEELNALNDGLLSPEDLSEDTLTFIGDSSLEAELLPQTMEQVNARVEEFKENAPEETVEEDTSVEELERRLTIQQYVDDGIITRNQGDVMVKNPNVPLSEFVDDDLFDDADDGEGDGFALDDDDPWYGVPEDFDSDNLGLGIATQAPEHQKKGIARFINKRLRTRGGLQDFKDVFDERILSQGEQNAIRAEGSRNGELLDAAVTKYLKDNGLGKLRNVFSNQSVTVRKNVMKAINDVLIGKKKLSSIPRELRIPVQRMRSHADRLTQRLIDEGLVDGDLHWVLNENKGVYMNRSYRVFDLDSIEAVDQFWEEIPNPVMQKALDWFRANVKRKPGESNKSFEGRVVAEAKGSIRDRANTDGKGRGLTRTAVELRDTSSLLGRGTVIREAAITGVNPGWKKKSPVAKFKTKHDAEVAAGKLVASGVIKSNEHWVSRTGKDEYTIRMDIPQELRALWGERTEADAVYAKTVMNMSSLIASSKLLKNVRSIGIKQGFLSKERQGRATQKISTRTDDPKFGPLSDLYGDPDFIDAFFGAMESPKAMGNVMRTYMAANSFTKMSKTVYNPITHTRNVGGNIFMMIGNGNMPTIRDGFTKTMLVDGMPRAWRDYINGKTGIDENALFAEHQKLVRLGVLKDEVRAGELKAMLDDVRDSDDNLAGFIDSRAGVAAKKVLAGASEFATSLYEAEDGMFKVATFNAERATYAEAYPGWTADQLDAKAAEITRNTMPTYSLVPEFVKSLRRWPLVAPFISFTTEMYRTNMNSLKLSKSEIASGNPVLIKKGWQRVAGKVTVLVATELAISGLNSLFGFDDEDEEAGRKNAAPWDRDGSLLFLPGKDGELTYVNTSYTNPYAVFSDPLRVMLGFGEDNDIPNVEEAIVNQFLKPFFGEELLSSALIDAARNKRSDTGGQIYNEQLPFKDRQQARVAYIWSKALEPGVLNQAGRFIKSFTGEKSSSGATYHPLKELLRTFGGANIVTLDLEQKLGFDARDYKDDMQEAKKILTTAISNNGNVSDSEVEKAYKNAEFAMNVIQDEFQKQVESKMKLGTPEDRLHSVIQGNGIAGDTLEKMLWGHRIKPNVGDKMREVIWGITDSNGERRYNQVERVVPEALADEE